jgi:hypothetical protein
MVRPKAWRFNDFGPPKHVPAFGSSGASVWRDHGRRAALHAPSPYGFAVQGMRCSRAASFVGHGSEDIGRC